MDSYVWLFVAISVLCGCGQCREGETGRPPAQAKSHPQSTRKEVKNSTDNPADIIPAPRGRVQLESESRGKQQDSSHILKQGNTKKKTSSDRERAHSDDARTSKQSAPKKTRDKTIAEMVAIIESVPPWYKGSYGGKLHIRYEQYGKKERKALIEAAKKIQGYYGSRTTPPDEQPFSELREAIVASIEKYPPANYNEIKGKIHLFLAMVFNMSDGYPLVFDDTGLFIRVTNMQPFGGGPFDPLRLFDALVSEGHGFRDLKQVLTTKNSEK